MEVVLFIDGQDELEQPARAESEIKIMDTHDLPGNVHTTRLLKTWLPQHTNLPIFSSLVSTVSALKRSSVST